MLTIHTLCPSLSVRGSCKTPRGMGVPPMNTGKMPVPHLQEPHVSLFPFPMISTISAHEAERRMFAVGA